MIDRNAVRVLPLPVGDDTRTLLPPWMSGTAYACGSVRPLNLDRNQSRISGSIRPRTSSFVDAVRTLCSKCTASRIVGNHGAYEPVLKEFAGWVAETNEPRRCQGRSTIMETALPPPRHRVARPRFALRSFIAYNRVVSTRAPLQPIGWPSATAPPFTLNFSFGIPSSRMTTRVDAAY